MGSTTFSTGTTITSVWLNDVNTLVWTVFNGATTAALARTALGLSTPFGVTVGGTGLAAGTAGGVLAFTGTTTIVSSGLLTANALMLGGGAAAAPTVMGSLGTTTTVLHGNAAGAPSFAAVTGNDFATQTANQIFAGPTSGGAAAPTFRTMVTADLPSTPLSVALTYIFDGGGSALTTGIKGDLSIPFACTITGVRLLADQSGSIVIDIWKDTYANYPPTVADTITASAKPTITTATKSEDTTLTGWTTAIAAGDTLRFNIDSITTCTRVVLTLKATKT